MKTLIEITEELADIIDQINEYEKTIKDEGVDRNRGQRRYDDLMLLSMRSQQVSLEWVLEDSSVV